MLDQSGDNNESESTKSSGESEERAQTQRSESSSEETNLNEFEQEQVKLGWDPKGKKSAEQWSADYPLFKKIKQLNEKVEHSQKLLEELANTNKKAEQYGYQKALNDLEKQRQDAIKAADPNMVKAIELEQQKIHQTYQPAVQKVDPVVAEFKTKYADLFNASVGEPDKKEVLDDLYALDNVLARKKLNPSEHIAELEKKIIKMHPEYFNKDDSRPKVNAVESGASSSRMSSKKTYSFKDLDKHQQEVATYLHDRHGKKIDDYIKDLVKYGTLK